MISPEYQYEPISYDRMADQADLVALRESIADLVPFADIDRINRLDASYHLAPKSSDPNKPPDLSLSCALLTSFHPSGRPPDEALQQLNRISLSIVHMGKLTVIEAGKAAGSESTPALNYLRDTLLPRMPRDMGAWWRKVGALVCIAEPDFVSFSASRLLEDTPYPITTSDSYMINRRFADSTRIEGTGHHTRTQVHSGAVIQSASQWQKRLQVFAPGGQYYRYNLSHQGMVSRAYHENGRVPDVVPSELEWLHGLTRVLRDAVASEPKTV